MAQLRVRMGCREESFELDNGSDLTGLLKVIAGKHGDEAHALLFGDDDAPAVTLLCFVASEQVEWDKALSDGDVVTLMTPISGG